MNCLFLECSLIFSDCTSLGVTETMESDTRGCFAAQQTSPSFPSGRCSWVDALGTAHQAGAVQPADTCSGSCPRSLGAGLPQPADRGTGRIQEAEGRVPSPSATQATWKHHDKGTTWFLRSFKEGSAFHSMKDTLKSARLTPPPQLCHTSPALLAPGCAEMTKGGLSQWPTGVFFQP